MSHSTKRYYSPELDALRFGAFFCVWCNHTSLPFRRWFVVQQMGEFGMLIFFVLSAYLIITLLLREKESTGSVKLGAFAMRRILRIWPLYYAVLFGSYFLAKHSSLIGPIPGGALLAFSLLAGNFYIARYGWVVGPLWSLSVEEQFYVLVPALVRFGRKKQILAICVAVIFVSYTALVVLQRHHAIPMSQIWTNSLVQFQFFAAGGVLAVLNADGRIKIQSGYRVLLIALGLVLWLISSRACQFYSFAPLSLSKTLLGYLLALFGTMAIFAGVLDASVKIPSPILYLGKISYGLYLFHELVWSLLEKVLQPQLTHRVSYCLFWLFALLCVIFAASISYNFFEKPILRYKARFERIKTRTA